MALFTFAGLSMCLTIFASIFIMEVEVAAAVALLKIKIKKR